MNQSDVFEFETLEQRFEFGFLTSLWDAVSWITDGARDIMETTSLAIGVNNVDHVVTIDLNFLVIRWTAVWYWE